MAINIKSVHIQELHTPSGERLLSFSMIVTDELFRQEVTSAVLNGIVKECVTAFFDKIGNELINEINIDTIRTALRFEVTNKLADRAVEKLLG